MASKIYEQIVERHIQQFVGVFSEDSNVIFKDEKNVLIHPGEYGRYREDACKNLLRLFLDRHVEISDGFIITPNDGRTKQCDIIVYNADVAPIVADGVARMFPAEEVRMIGEIKSTLSKQEFIDALRKMADNKKVILDGRGGTTDNTAENDPETYNTIGSFLICNKLDFNFRNLRYDEIYEGIDRKYWHNAILSIEDGTMIYTLRFEDFSAELRAGLDRMGLNTNLVVSYVYPIYTQKNETIATRENYLTADTAHKYRHIKKFFSGIASCCKEVWVYTYDPVEYLDMAVPSLYKEE